MTLQPMRGHMFLKMIRRPATASATGIVIPEVAASVNTRIAEVVAIGNPAIREHMEIPWEVKVGDKVVIRENSGKVIGYNGQSFIIAREDELEGIERE